MKRFTIKKYSILLLVLLLALLPGLETINVHAATVKTLEKITATYLGGAVAVGEPIDLDKLYVEGHYRVVNGSSVTEKRERITDTKNMLILPETVVSKGSNYMAVVYKDKVAEFTVTGKVVSSISATYTGEAVTVGESFSRDKVVVTVIYSDGSVEQVEDFFLYSTEITEVGDNIFPVIYGDSYSFITVKGKEKLKISELLAVYNGGDLVVGNYIDKSQIHLMAIYNNGDIKEVEQFIVSPETVTKEGKNEIKLVYGEASTTIVIRAEKKEIVDVSVSYKGPGVIVGTEIDLSDVEVLATYNDGSVERTGDYMLSQTKITKYGDNIIFVYCDEFIDVITVTGVEGFVPNYDNSRIDFIFNADYTSYSMITLGMAEGLSTDAFRIEPVDELITRRVIHRAVLTENYMSFLLAYDDDEMITKFPMAVKVTLPYGFDAEHFAVYYTPDQESIVAKLDGMFLDDEKTEYQFIAYEPGTYILVNEVKNLLVEEIVVEEKVTLGPRRNYSIKPVVLPRKAENRDVEYWSSNEEVATVNENGKVVTHAEGVCEIWVKATDGSGVYSIVTITVKDPKKK